LVALAEGALAPMVAWIESHQVVQWVGQRPVALLAERIYLRRVGARVSVGAAALEIRAHRPRMAAVRIWGAVSACALRRFSSHVRDSVKPA
jgi:hypothetical protein